MTDNVSEEVLNAVNAIKTLIKPIDVKTYCPVDANINDVRLKKAINTTQGRDIMKALGVTLYDRLMAEWDASGEVPSGLPDGTYVDPISTPSAIPPIIDGDTTDYRTLYRWVTPALIWWSFAGVLPFLATNIGEKGLIQPADIYGNSADPSWYRVLLVEAKDQAQFEQQALLDYICKTFNSDTEVMAESSDVGTDSLEFIFSSRSKRRRNGYGNGRNNCKTCN